MSKMSEIKLLIGEAERRNDHLAKEWLNALYSLSISEIVDDKMYEVIIDRIKSVMRSKQNIGD